MIIFLVFVILSLSFLTFPQGLNYITKMDVAVTFKNTKNGMKILHKVRRSNEGEIDGKGMGERKKGKNLENDCQRVVKFVEVVCADQKVRNWRELM